MAVRLGEVIARKRRAATMKRKTGKKKKPIMGYSKSVLPQIRKEISLGGKIPLAKKGKLKRLTFLNTRIRFLK